MKKLTVDEIEKNVARERARLGVFPILSRLTRENAVRLAGEAFVRETEEKFPPDASLQKPEPRFALTVKSNCWATLSVSWIETKKLTAEEIRRNVSASGWTAHKLRRLSRENAVRLTGETWVRALNQTIPALHERRKDTAIFRAELDFGEGVRLAAYYFWGTGDLERYRLPEGLVDLPPDWFEVIAA